MAVICSSRRFLININSHPEHSVFWQVIRSEGMAKHTDLQILNNLITGLFSVWSCISYEFSREHQCGPVTAAVSGVNSRECSAGGRAGCSGLLPKTVWFKRKPNYQLMWVTVYLEAALSDCWVCCKCLPERSWLTTERRKQPLKNRNTLNFKWVHQQRSWLCHRFTE